MGASIKVKSAEEIRISRMLGGDGEISPPDELQAAAYIAAAAAEIRGRWSEREAAARARWASSEAHTTEMEIHHTTRGNSIWRMV